MGVPQDGGAVVVAVHVQRGAEFGVSVRVQAPAAAAAATGPVVDGAEGRCGEGGEDAGVLGDRGTDALAAAQASCDEVEGVLAVDLGAGGAAGCAAVVAADEELSGGKVVVGDLPDDFAGGGEDVQAATFHPYGSLAAAESLDLVRVAAQVAELGEGRQLADGSGRSLGAHVRVPP